MLAWASIFTLIYTTTTTTFAQSTSKPTVVCIAGQCIQGYSNLTLGALLTAPGAATNLHLLPGQYTTSSNPQLLHDLLTSSSATLSSSPGFDVPSSVRLPLDLTLQPGVATFSQARYAGESSFIPLSPNIDASSNIATTDSLAFSSGIFAIIGLGNSSKERLVLWDSVPDLSQLPLAPSSRNALTLLDIQSNTCSPPCSGNGVCSSNGVCTCPNGFTGSSCESCAPGFFGPTCQACPADCDACDEGNGGTGRCLKRTVQGAPETCNCVNGVCGANGQCTCNPGFTKGDDEKSCAKCLPGFFLTSTGDCQVCTIGCDRCADTTGACTSCKSRFTQDPTDRTKCNPPRSATNAGTICPNGAFGNGPTCSACNSACETCTAGTANDCVLCAQGSYLSNGACVAAGEDGVCQGSNLIADNTKRQCDTCGAKCTKCNIPGFNVGSLPSEIQCTECLPGFVLSNGKCVESCPDGTFISPDDNFTCLPCDSRCTTCASSATFCLSCSSNLLATANGTCTASCPPTTFPSSGSCPSCHSDCATCSGTAFNQCTSCPAARPVLSNGRCLPTCGKSQYFDGITSSCQLCDGGCASCSGPGESSCLSCSRPDQVLQAGVCVAAQCTSGQDSAASSGAVVPGLGLCLSDLVVVPKPSSTDGDGDGSSEELPPLPEVTGLYAPTQQGLKLEWWQILLMVLGGVFILCAIAWCLRRRFVRRREAEMKKKNGALGAFAQTTVIFGNAGASQGRAGWKVKLLRFGQSFFSCGFLGCCCCCGRRGKERRERRRVEKVEKKQEKLKNKITVVKNEPIDDRNDSDARKVMKMRAAEEGNGYGYGHSKGGMYGFNSAPTVVGDAYVDGQQDFTMAYRSRPQSQSQPLQHQPLRVPIARHRNEVPTVDFNQHIASQSTSSGFRASKRTSSTLSYINDANGHPQLQHHSQRSRHSYDSHQDQPQSVSDRDYDYDNDDMDEYASRYIPQRSQGHSQHSGTYDHSGNSYSHDGRSGGYSTGASSQSPIQTNYPRRRSSAVSSAHSHNSNTFDSHMDERIRSPPRPIATHLQPQQLRSPGGWTTATADDEIIKIIGSYNKPATPLSAAFGYQGYTSGRNASGSGSGGRSRSPSRSPNPSSIPPRPLHPAPPGSSNASHVTWSRDHDAYGGRNHGYEQGINRLSAPSLYSHATGHLRRVPEPRQPLRSGRSDQYPEFEVDTRFIDFDGAPARGEEEEPLPKSRFSMSTIGGATFIARGANKEKERNKEWDLQFGRTKLRKATKPDERDKEGGEKSRHRLFWRRGEV